MAIKQYKADVILNIVFIILWQSLRTIKYWYSLSLGT